MSKRYQVSTMRQYKRSGLYAGLFLALSLPVQAAPGFSEWGPPQATVGGGCPIESPDGNRLYS